MVPVISAVIGLGEFIFIVINGESIVLFVFSKWISFVIRYIVKWRNSNNDDNNNNNIG